MTQDDLNSIHKEQLASRDSMIEALLKNIKEEREVQARNIRYIAMTGILSIAIVMGVFFYGYFTCDYTTISDSPTTTTSTNSNNEVQGDMNNITEREVTK